VDAAGLDIRLLCEKKLSSHLDDRVRASFESDALFKPGFAGVHERLACRLRQRKPGKRKFPGLRLPGLKSAFARLIWQVQEIFKCNTAI
jgi:hypothetical protein